jgi:hypothetical protein
MGIGIKSVFMEMGLEVEAQVNMDSSAARSISSRTGAGRVRHVEVRELWVQEMVVRGELSIIKVRGGDVRGEDTVAEGLTKHVERSKTEVHMERCGFV